MSVTTLAEAQEEFLTALAAGEMLNCPCCSRVAKVYRRSLNRSMMVGLLWLIWQYTRSEDWIDVPREAPWYVINSREFTKLKYWNLVEQKPNDDPKKRTSGLWKPTESGVAFMSGGTRLHQYALVFDDGCIGFDGPQIGPAEAFGEPFDFEKLMLDSSPPNFGEVEP